jgi:hypothetical protein
VAGFFSRNALRNSFAVAILIFGTALCSLAQMDAYGQPLQTAPGQNAPDQAAQNYDPAQQPYGQPQPYDQPAQPTKILSQNELANLVAPIALYPDALLAQVLVACTYPDQLVEAQRFLQQNRNLPPRELVEAAQQQNWDPSIQALVAFPSVVALMNGDFRWTLDLGDAWLAQQADVMDAVQELRAEARQNGQLDSTPQLSVNTEVQGDRSAIEIQPANPQSLFIPSYDPYAVWGPPVEGAYPAVPYAQGSGFGAVIGTVANLAGLLPGFAGFLGPRSWGWALSWLVNALFVNNSFFSDFGFHGYGGGGGTSVWVHNGGRGFGGRYGNNTVAGWRGRGNIGSEGWRGYGNGSRAGNRGYGGEFFERSRMARQNDLRGDMRADRGGNWRQFNGNYGRGRDPYVGNSAVNRGGSLTASRSFAPGSRYSGFANSGREASEAGSRTLTAGRAWDRSAGSAWARSSGRNSWGGRSEMRQPNFSASRSASRSSYARGSFGGAGSFGREFSSGRHSASRESGSRNGEFASRGFSARGFSSRGFSSRSHESKPKHYASAKFSAPHFSKSHGGGGGHSSHGHSGGGRHRG